MQMIVLGMHRSGTSLITRLLHEMGAFVGDESELLPKMDCNAEGFWERQDVHDVNEAALASMRATWDAPLNAIDGQLSDRGKGEFEYNAEAVVEKLNQHTLWVIKDPRMSLLFRFWQPLLDSPVSVVSWRHPLEVAASLKTRDGLPFVYGLALWELYMVKALQSVQNIPYCLISYSDLMRTPITTIEKLCQDVVDMGGKSVSELSRKQIDSIINPSLKHEKHNPQDELEHLSSSQLRLLDWLKLPHGSFKHNVSVGALSVLEEIGDLREALKRTSQQIEASNAGLERWRKRTFQAINSADALSDASEVLLSSASWKVGRMLGASTRMLHNAGNPEQFIHKVSSDYHQWRKNRDLNVIAIINSYNEELLIRKCMEHLIAQGVNFYIIDNESTDRTLEIAHEYEGRGLVGVEIVPRYNQYDFEPILRRKEELTLELDADWFMHVDADEFRFAPPPYETLKEAFVAVEDAGFNAIEFMEYTFVATQEHPEHSPEDFLETMLWYYPFQPFRPHRMNAWKRCGMPIEMVRFGGHQVNFPGRKVFPEYFILKHYTYISHAHAIEKFRKLKPRQGENEFHGFRHHIIESDIVLPSETELYKFTSDAELIADNPRKTRFVEDRVEERLRCKS